MPRRAGLAPAAFPTDPNQINLQPSKRQNAHRLAQCVASFNRRVQDPPYGLRLPHPTRKHIAMIPGTAHATHWTTAYPAVGFLHPQSAIVGVGWGKRSSTPPSRKSATACIKPSRPPHVRPTISQETARFAAASWWGCAALTPPYNYGSATIPMKDSNFLGNLNTSKPAGYPAFTRAAIDASQ